jgi:2-methylcitrate dehydratase PrpD
MNNDHRSSPTPDRIAVPDLVHALASAPVRARDRQAARLRLADTAFATLVGSRTAQGRRAAALAADRYGAAALSGRVFRFVAACRMTEIDDVDLESCVTPGSVVVPTVLAIASEWVRSGGAAPGLDTVLDMITHGYEIALGLGEAIRGPERLATGVWPTLTIGGVTAAAVTSALLGASDERLAAAVALAAEHSTAGNPRGDAREILLAEAVVTGVGCALAVQHGFSVSGGKGGALGGLLDAGMPDATEVSRIHRPRIKEFCSARQAMTAVSAVRSILAAEDLHGADIDRIDVEAPAAYAAMLDKPSVGSRRESLSSAPYQLALAALEPAGLLDVNRQELHSHEAFRSLMAAVHIHVADDLTSRYPTSWPARVWVYSGERVFEAVADEVPGERDLTAERLTAKMSALSGAAPGLPRSVWRIVERAVTATDVTDLTEITTLLDGGSLSDSDGARTPGDGTTADHADHVYADLTKE